MVNVMQPWWQDVPAVAGREMSLPTATGAVEIQFRSDVAIAEPAVYRVIIMEPSPATAESLASQQHEAPGTYASGSTGYTGVWSRPDLLDEEPTWEDAAWQ